MRVNSYFLLPLSDRRGIKQELSWEIYQNLDEIKEKVRAFLEDFSLITIASITGWDYIQSALATVA